MIENIYYARRAKRVGLFILILSFLMAAQTVFFSGFVLAQDDTDLFDDDFYVSDKEPEQCPALGTGSISVQIVSEANVISAGTNSQGQVTITNVLPDDLFGFKGYIFLRSFDAEGQLGYPLAMGETEQFLLPASSIKQAPYELYVPPYVTDGAYVLEVYIGQYDADTAMALAMSDTEPDGLGSVEVYSADVKGALLQNLTINGESVTFGQSLEADASSGIFEVTAELMNTTEGFLTGEINWDLHRGLLVGAEEVVSSQTKVFQLIPSQVYKADLKAAITPGLYLLIANIKSEGSVQKLFIPVSYGIHDSRFSVAPYLTALSVSGSGDAAVLSGCAEYLRASLFSEALPASPISDTLGYQLSYSGLSDMTLSGEEFTRAPEQALFAEFTGKKLVGEYTYTAEMMREGNVIDSLTVKGSIQDRYQEQVTTGTARPYYFGSFVLFIVFSIVIVLVLAAARYVYLQGRMKNREDSGPSVDEI